MPKRNGLKEKRASFCFKIFSSGAGECNEHSLTPGRYMAEVAPCHDRLSYHTKKGAFPTREGSMEHPAFQNQDLIPAMTTHELKEISDIKEIKRSLNATIRYLENRESSIFAVVRDRLPKQGGESHVD